MKDIAIYGAGGYGREVACLINAINEVKKEWNLIGFFDDGIQKGTKTKYGDILGGIDELNNINHQLFLTISIGTPHILNNIINRIYSTHIEFANLFHPLAEIHESVKVGIGNIITFGNYISCDAIIGNFNVFNTMCAVGHDTVIGSYNVFNPRSQISGSVCIGDINFFGLNSSVLQAIKVGNNNKIGAYSFVTRDVKDNESLIGIPAKKMPVPNISENK